MRTFRTNLWSWIKLVSTVAIGRLSCHGAIFAASDSELPGAAWANPWRTDWKILEHFGSLVRKAWGRFLMIPRCSDLALALANSSYDKLTNTRDFEYSKLSMVWFLPLRALEPWSLMSKASQKTQMTRLALCMQLFLLSQTKTLEWFWTSAVRCTYLTLICAFFSAGITRSFHHSATPEVW